MGNYAERSKYFKVCKSCTKRSETCHSGCEEYAKEFILGIILEADARKETELRTLDYDIAERRAVIMAKKSPRAMRKNGIIRHRGGRR